jgi:hypothetical protein
VISIGLSGVLATNSISADLALSVDPCPHFYIKMILFCKNMNNKLSVTKKKNRATHKNIFSSE